MDKTKKELSLAGKKGAQRKKEKQERTRKELLTTLSKYVSDKTVLNFIQARWSNGELEKLLQEYTK